MQNLQLKVSIPKTVGLAVTSDLLVTVCPLGFQATLYKITHVGKANAMKLKHVARLPLLHLFSLHLLTFAAQLHLVISHAFCYPPS